MSSIPTAPPEPPRRPEPEIPTTVPKPEGTPNDPVNVPPPGPDVIFPGSGEPLGIPPMPGLDIPGGPTPAEII